MLSKHRLGSSVTNGARGKYNDPTVDLQFQFSCRSVILNAMLPAKADACPEIRNVYCMLRAVKNSRNKALGEDSHGGYTQYNTCDMNSMCFTWLLVKKKTLEQLFYATGPVHVELYCSLRANMPDPNTCYRALLTVRQGPVETTPSSYHSYLSGHLVNARRSPGR